MKLKTVNIITLGCSKNLVDSEHLMLQFKANGFEIMHDDNEPADIVLINTCGFILDAKEESIGMIMDYVAAKERGDITKLYVMGCLSARYRNDLEKEIPEVDRFFGKFDFDAIIQELGIQKRKDLLFDRHLTTPSHFAYLKIAEGCDRTCAFCAIPQFTGKHKSVPIEDLVTEAENLAKKGVKELLLISQELTYYGIDLYKERKLSELIDRLSQINGIEWIRLHYAYPTNFPMDLLQTIKNNPKVCKYLDIPLQHISSNVLKNMRRNITEEQTRELVKSIRKEMPEMALRTTMLVGHPGETEEDFQLLLDFVKEAKFDRLGVFPYSHEDDTHGFNTFKDEVPQDVKEKRAEILMEIQQNISEEIAAKKIGKTLKVIIDRIEGEFYIGRTEYDSPEVDGEVLIKADHLQIGNFYQVKITASDLFDLFGEIE
ncbi:MAG TPA: 30S ribosomal protein S12 methylthiotransferase RimO [Prolixibacteraceae bacterium]|nr:30S ribosomal protein S12 methylthiotransferase RimO [Prolixibacteraceae bacterium]